MTIKPTDWVLFTINRKTYFGVFNKLPISTQTRLENLHSNWNESYTLLANNVVGLRLHLVTSEEGAKYAEKTHFLFKGLNSSIYSIFNLPSGRHWLDGEMPEIAIKEGLNGKLGFESKKILGLDYLRRLCDNIVLPEPKTFKESTHKAYWKSHEDEIKELLTRLRNKSNKLEERPMKAKQFLVELHKYNKEKKATLSEKEAIVLEYKEQTPVNAKEIVDLLKSIYIDADDDWNLTQDVLTIEDGCYKIGSGHVDYSEERLKQFSKGYLLKLNMIIPDTYKFYYKEKVQKNGKESTVTGEEYIRIPKGINIEKVLNFYQKRFPNKNYTFDKSSIKKELSERSQKLKDLPQKGETPAKELRKVCYRPVGGQRVFRGVYKDVKHYVESGNYEFVQKAAWKRQILDDEDNLLVKGEANKSNINLPPDRGKKLGQRKEKRKERETLKQIKSLRKLQSLHRRIGQTKPGDAERKLQSEIDKQKYIEKRKEQGKKPRSYRAYRAFEAKVLDDPKRVSHGDDAGVIVILRIKAKSEEHAKKLAEVLSQQKGKEVRLTGNIGDWIKQTGKNRK